MTWDNAPRRASCFGAAPLALASLGLFYVGMFGLMIGLGTDAMSLMCPACADPVGKLRGIRTPLLPKNCRRCGQFLDHMASP